jgi:fatty acid desaturase
MQPRAQMLVASDYTRELRALLPASAFVAAPRKLWLLLAHLVIVICGYLGFRHSTSVIAFGLLALLIGHAMACIAFLTHELSHNTIVRSRYPLEVFFWALNLIPATVWRRVHNQAHHIHANTTEDPDRKYLASEDSVVTRWYSRIFYPHRHTVRWNPLVAFHFVPYILRNTLAAFYPNSRKPALVPFKPFYTPRQRISVLAELLAIVIIQIVVFHLVGSRWSAYLWASLAVVLITSAIVMAYVFTNHFLNPLAEITDPLTTTTSVVVSPLCDLLHSNFSYHTEHHLFPHMNSDFYPEVSKILEQRYPDRYYRVPIGEAWHLLWMGDQYVPHSTNATIPY